jgi:hypothetical protein
MRVSVSNLEQYRQWRDAEDESLGALMARLWSGDTPDTLRGKAFHTCMERAEDGETELLKADGFTFLFDIDCTISLPKRREVMLTKQYGPLLVRGRIDGGEGKVISDYKSTASFDADRFQLGYPWRYYLDMADADRFDWHIFEMSELATEPKAYRVRAYHQMSQWRYPNLNDDCTRLAEEFYRLIIDTPELHKAYQRGRKETPLEKFDREVKASVDEYVMGETA